MPHLTARPGPHDDISEQRCESCERVAYTVTWCLMSNLVSVKPCTGVLVKFGAGSCSHMVEQLLRTCVHHFLLATTHDGFACHFELASTFWLYSPPIFYQQDPNVMSYDCSDTSCIMLSGRFELSPYCPPATTTQLGRWAAT